MIQRNIAQESNALNIEAIKLKPEKDILVRDGTPKVLISMEKHHKDSQKRAYGATNAETHQVGVGQQFGASQLIRRKNGIIVTQ